MQQVASQQPNPNSRAAGNSRSSIIAILALLLFALSGLMTGFAIGTFTRPKQTAPQGNTNKTNPSGNTAATPVQTQGPQVTQTPNILALGLGCPGVQYSFQEVRGTAYQVQAQVLDKSSECKNGGGKPLHMTGITCRLWLTKDNKFGDNIPNDRIKSVDTLQQAFPKEEENALNFNGTPQVQPCNAQGPTIWNYHITPSLDEGTYFLLVLTDWQGTLYNWTAKQITVMKANQAPHV
ncbi:MAG: hypothetical protein PVS3B3_33940 [Ktedonobacteraceae bacterium]